MYVYIYIYIVPFIIIYIYIYIIFISDSSEHATLPALAPLYLFSSEINEFRRLPSELFHIAYAGMFRVTACGKVVG